MTLLAIPAPADWDLDLADDYDDDLPPAAAEAPEQDVVAPDPAGLAAVGLDERTALLDAYVRGELGRVLHVAPGSIDVAGRTMNSLGVGSINGLELQARMEAALGIDVDLQRLLRANSAAELIDCLAGQLGPEDSPHKSAARRSTGTPAAAA
ncbi:acyl carrier protein [Streptomyces sp. VNUA116]|uniref:acyl carrier protein n=1 Tax=Streptomyces sp. VNUA116 TaxID=3062449 RepID=UPI002675C795|nr:acyl carrier protein [Streptomyces sp. VNUA116]WKU44923.1 acyl carrier protein [Streptomyces sp. VNUA116]